MKIDKQLMEKIISTIKIQWKLASLVVLILISLSATLLIPVGSKNLSPNPLQTTNNPSTQRPDPTKKPSNLFGFLFGAQKKGDSPSQQQKDASIKTPTNIINSSTSKSSITQIKLDGTKTTQPATGGVMQTAQGTINPNISIINTFTNNTPADDLRMVFQNPDGSTFTYIPPGTPPDEVRWARYTNNPGKYAINYPYNWQFVYSINNGHEGVALYPPGVDPSNPTAPYVGFGITDSFLLPAAGDASSALVTHVIADGINGDLYTDGPLGNSYVASVFSYTGKYFGLGASKTDATFAYVYYYMLNSLTFNIE